jgi:hypothetical protein
MHPTDFMPVQIASRGQYQYLKHMTLNIKPKHLQRISHIFANAVDDVVTFREFLG